MSGKHPSRSELAAAAAGDTELRRRLAPHLQICAPCRDELARFLGVLEAAVEETVAARPGCPPPETLAGLSEDVARKDPHVGSCPLCREELKVLWELERSREVVAAFELGVPHRSELTVRSVLPVAAAAPGQVVKIVLEEGAAVEATVGGVDIRLSVAGGTLAVNLEGGQKRRLELILENDLLERHITLDVSKTVLTVGRWKIASVRPVGRGTQ